MSAIIPETVNVTVSAATHEDVERLVAYGLNFWQQTLYFSAGISYDVEEVTRRTHELVDEGIVLYAHESDGALIGLMLVMIGPFPMNANFTAACEWVFYVDPWYRRGGLGRVLIEEAEAMLKERGVKLFTMVSLSNLKPEAANKLYISLGFEHTETNFTKDLTWQP